MAERYKMDEGGEAASATRARAAFVEQNTALNELRSAKLDASAMRARNLEAKTDAEQVAAALSLERGDWADHAQRQRNISELAAQRVRAEDEYRQWQGAPVHPADPVEALIASRASEPLTQQWLRQHPADALALATGSDPRRQAKIVAADADARAEGHAVGSQRYIEHVDSYLGGTRGSASSSGGTSGGGAEVRLTAKEAENATDGTLQWNYSDPTGQNRWKKGDAIGIKEFARRKQALQEQGAYDKLD